MPKTVKPEPIVDWTPTPGFVLCEKLGREDVLKLYDKPGQPSLILPDKSGRISDSVGVGRVVKIGPPALDIDTSKAETKAEADLMRRRHTLGLSVGDYVAFMSYTDQLIEIDGIVYSLVGYDKIRAVREGDK